MQNPRDQENPGPACGPQDLQRKPTSVGHSGKKYSNSVPSCGIATSVLVRGAVYFLRLCEPEDSENLLLPLGSCSCLRSETRAEADLELPRILSGSVMFLGKHLLPHASQAGHPAAGLWTPGAPSFPAGGQVRKHGSAFLGSGGVGRALGENP